VSKALVDSEQIITQLRAEGYEISGPTTVPDLVVVNTCGFIDEAVQESLDAIGEALHENQGDRDRLSRCEEKRERNGVDREVHPKVLCPLWDRAHATAKS